MKFAQKTEYALRALTYLASRADTAPVSARQIAADCDIPHRFCEQVMGDLRKAGVLDASRGSSGGTWIARDPEGITVAEIVDLIEGPVISQACLDPFDPDQRAAHSAIQELWLDLQINLRARLAATSIADLVKRQEELDSSARLTFQI